MNKTIHLYSLGGCGDQILAFRLRFLLKQIHKDLKIYNYCCTRQETWNMLRVIYPNVEFQKRDEDFFDRVGYYDYSDTFMIYPDKLFRGRNAFPLKDYNITNFSVKQTRTLLGKWKPENYISMAINSITPGYTYHSVPELAYKLARQFSDKKIYLPLLVNWNNKSLPMFNFPNPPDNLDIDIQPEFSKVFDILCKSEYCVCTDNAIMHICHDLGMPYLTLDPQYKNSPFEARWRPYGDYHSIPIGALVDDIVDVIKTQINILETQMISTRRIFRENKDWKETLLFKE